MNQNPQAVALVTGASSGIGLATARTLVKAGYRVFGTTRRVSSKAHAGITMIACDVTDDASVSAAVASVIDQGGGIDLLVNNAGIGLIGAAEESSIAQSQALFDVNVFGVFRMTNAVLPIMRRQGQGRIINLSSILGLIPAPYAALYAASKHAIEGYSESLDHETRAFGVRVTLVEPGYTRTAFEQSTLAPDQPIAVYGPVRDSMRQHAIKNNETGDTPDVVAEAILKAIASDNPKSRYTAGKLASQARMLRRFVPEAAFSKSLRKQNNLPV
jgi:short-subunit dehydrogenase